MNPNIFCVSYTITTQESVEHGDYAERGWIEEFCSLRVAIKALHATRTNAVDGAYCVEADGCGQRGYWSVTVYNGTEFETGAQECRTLHFDRNLTRATRSRIARLAGAKTVPLPVTLAPTVRDISHETAYGVTVKAQNSIRCF